MIRPFITMTPRVAAKSSYSRWLVLLTAAMLGMFFASNIEGADDLHNVNSTRPSWDKANLTEWYTIAPPALPITECDLEFEPRDQFVITRDKLVRKKCVVVKSKDQIWMACARQAHLCPGDLSRMQCTQLIDDRWSPRNINDLALAHADNKNYTTIIYVHGNRTNESWAISRGLQVYETLFANQPDANRPPIRFVIYAWKSEQEKIRLAPDYKIKSARAPVVGQNFGLFLEQFTDRKMVLCGFSLGSQVILAGLSRNNQIQAQAQTGSRYKVALLAPAMNPDYVGPCLTQLIYNPLVERTEVFYSQNDRAIRAAEKIARKSCRDWIPVFQRLSHAVNPISPVHVFDLTSSVNKKHAAITYVGSGSVQQSLSKMVCEISASNLARFEQLKPTEKSILAPSILEPATLDPIGEDRQMRIPDMVPNSLELIAPN